MCLCWRDLTDLILVAQAAACTLRPILDLIVCHTFSQPIWQLWGAKPAWTLCILTKWILILHQCSKKPNVFTSNLDLLFERRFCRATAVTHLCKGVHEIVRRRMICRRTVYLEINTCVSRSRRAAIYAKLWLVNTNTSPLWTRSSAWVDGVEFDHCFGTKVNNLIPSLTSDERTWTNALHAHIPTACRRVEFWVNF